MESYTAIKLKKQATATSNSMDEFQDVVLTETQEVILNESVYVKLKNR